MEKMAIVLVLLLTACASGPHYSEAPVPGDEEALVYFFRGYGHSVMNATYTFEDTKVVSLGNKEYSWITVQPGEYRIKAAEPMSRSLEMPIEVSAGGVYYVGYNIERNNGGAKIILKQYTAEDAARILEDSDHKEVARLPAASQ